MKNKYWLQDDPNAAINYLSEYRAKWNLWNNSPFKQSWLRNFLAYYSPVINAVSWDTSFVFQGVEGELLKMYTPKARTLIRQLVSLTTKQPLSFQGMAQTQGDDVIQAVKLVNSLADQIVENETLDIKGDQLAEAALVTGNAFLKTSWRTDKGVPYVRDENGVLIYTGGVDMSVYTVFDVYYDINIQHWDKLNWVEVRTIKNRWDLIAQHPDLRDKLLSIPPVNAARGPNNWFERTLMDDDTIFVYEMYAKPTPSLPSGRMLFYADNETVLHDGPNIYEAIPVEPMTPEIVMSCGLGYPVFSNILAAQEMFDNSLSAIATNQAQFAVQSVTVPRGSGLNVQELNGMRIVSFTPQSGVAGGGKPEPLQLTQSSPETFKFIDVLGELMNDLSGVAGALRGAPPPGITSGTAIATLSANALDFIQSVNKSYQVCMRKSMMHAINCYKNFAKIPQVVEMKGRNNQVSYQEFTGDQLQNITGMKILISNPLMQTVSGRLEISKELMSMPKELWPKYVSILEGRPLSEIYKSDLSSEDLIQMEDEALIKGDKVVALATDDHAAHIQSHAGLLNDPSIRMNGRYIQNILDHIEEHKQLAQNTDPFLLGIIRTGKIPDMPPPQNRPPAVGAPPAQGGPLGMPTTQTSEPAQDLLQRA